MNSNLFMRVYIQFKFFLDFKKRPGRLGNLVMETKKLMVKMGFSFSTPPAVKRWIPAVYESL